MRISDWSSDVCSSDLGEAGDEAAGFAHVAAVLQGLQRHGHAAHGRLKGDVRVKHQRKTHRGQFPGADHRGLAADHDVDEVRSIDGHGAGGTYVEATGGTLTGEYGAPPREGRLPKG